MSVSADVPPSRSSVDPHAVAAVVVGKHPVLVFVGHTGMFARNPRGREKDVAPGSTTENELRAHAAQQFELLLPDKNQPADRHRQARNIIKRLKRHGVS